MSKPSVIVSLTAIYDSRFKVVKSDDSSMGYYIKYKGKLFEPDITLHEVLDKNTTNGDAYMDYDESDIGISNPINVQGSIIGL
jgi:hypothetical protein